MTVSTGMDSPVSKGKTPCAALIMQSRTWPVSRVGTGLPPHSPPWTHIFRGGNPRHSTSRVCPRANSKLVEMLREYPISVAFSTQTTLAASSYKQPGKTLTNMSNSCLYISAQCFRKRQWQQDILASSPCYLEGKLFLLTHPALGTAQLIFFIIAGSYTAFLNKPNNVISTRKWHIVLCQEVHKRNPFLCYFWWTPPQKINSASAF